MAYPAGVEPLALRAVAEEPVTDAALKLPEPPPDEIAKLRAELDRSLVRGAQLYAALVTQTERVRVLTGEFGTLNDLARCLVMADDRANEASAKRDKAAWSTANRARIAAIAAQRRFLEARQARP